MGKEEIKEMSENDKIQTLKNYFTNECIRCLECNFNFKPKNYKEFKTSLTLFVDFMELFGGFIDPRRIGRFELAEVGDELGVRINNFVILERERLPYEDRFCYVMFDVINYVVENLMDLDEVMVRESPNIYRLNIWLNE